MTSRALEPETAARDGARVYSACFFDDGLVVPRVSVIEADSDERAAEEVRSLNRFKRRELWDRYRLVAAFRPEPS